MHSHSDGPPAKENNACLCQTGLAACKHSSRKSCSSKIPFPQATLGRSLLFYFQGLKKLKSNYSKSVFKYSELQIYTYVVIHPCQGCMWIYYIGVTGHLHFWQNDQGLLHATAVKWGWKYVHWIRVSTQKENSLAAPARIQTCNLSIKSLGLYQQTFLAAAVQV